MCLFDFVEEQRGGGAAVECRAEESALAQVLAKQQAHGVLVLVFAHVEALHAAAAQQEFTEAQC